jgi:hypothetical protein
MNKQTIKFKTVYSHNEVTFSLDDQQVTVMVCVSRYERERDGSGPDGRYWSIIPKQLRVTSYLRPDGNWDSLNRGDLAVFQDLLNMQVTEGLIDLYCEEDESGEAL